MRVLIAIPSPREIEPVKQAIDALTAYDRLWIKNHPQSEAYSIMRNYFLDHDEYTHLAIAPDDLVLGLAAFEQLVLDLKERPARMPVLCGYANLELSKEKAVMSINSIDYLPSLQRQGREYRYENMSYLESLGRLDNDQNIIQVKYAGFPCMIIRRDVVGKTSLAQDEGGDPINGCCIDVVFCNECDKLGIPIFCDTRCCFLHLKTSEKEGDMIGDDVRSKTEEERKVRLDRANV